MLCYRVGFRVRVSGLGLGFRVFGNVVGDVATAAWLRI